MAAIHSIKIKKGSKMEARFMNALKSVGVDIGHVLCKPGYIFNTDYDEYVVSDGLFRQIYTFLYNR